MRSTTNCHKNRGHFWVDSYTEGKAIGWTILCSKLRFDKTSTDRALGEVLWCIDSIYPFVSQQLIWRGPPITNDINQRSETPITQLQAFRSILSLITRYPGLRRIYVTQYADDVKNVTYIVPPVHIEQNAEEWNFWHSVVSACLNDTTISSTVENTPPGKLGLLVNGERSTDAVMERLWSLIDDRWVEPILETKR